MQFEKDCGRRKQKLIHFSGVSSWTSSQTWNFQTSILNFQTFLISGFREIHLRTIRTYQGLNFEEIKVIIDGFRLIYWSSQYSLELSPIVSHCYCYICVIGALLITN